MTTTTLDMRQISFEPPADLVSRIETFVDGATILTSTYADGTIFRVKIEENAVTLEVNRPVALDPKTNKLRVIEVH